MKCFYKPGYLFWMHLMLFLSALQPLVADDQSEEKDMESSGAELFVPGAVIRGFTVPRFDANGNLACRITGESALILDKSQAKLEKLRYLSLKDGTNDFEVTTTECIYNYESDVLSTDGLVRLYRPGFQITGIGMGWDVRNNRGSIHSNVIMQIENIDQGLTQ